MAPRREFAEDKFAPSAFRGMSDPAGGMFNSTSPSGLPVGQVLLGAGGMSLKKAMDFVNAVKEGRIDPNSDEGMRETLNLALLTIGRGAPTARPGGIAPALEGTILPAERGATSQLGYRGTPTIENILELPPGAIRGTSAEGAPRIAYLKPEQRYQMALDRAANPRPLANYERPAMDQTFVRPEDIRPFNEGNVRGTVDPIAALETESLVPVSNAPKFENIRRQEAQRVSDFMSEGNVAPTQQRTLRRLAGESEADFRLRQELALGDEAGAIASGRNPPNRVARALQLTERQPASAPETFSPSEMQGPRQITPESLIGPVERQGPPELIGPRQTPQMTLIEQLRSGQISGREYQAAIDAQRTAAAAPAVESPLARAMASAPEGVAVDPVQAAINAAKQRADAMARSHADSAAQQAVIDAAAQRAGTGSGPMFPNYQPYSPPSMTVPLVGAGAIGAGALALNSGSQQAQPPGQAPKPIDPEIKTREGRPVYFTGPAYDINSKDMYDYTLGATPAEVLGSRRATASAIDSAYAPVVASPAPATASQQAVQQAVQQARTQTAPMPPTRPAELAREQPGILSKIFGQPATTRQLFEQSQADPSDSGAWMRAERQYAKTHKDEPNFDVTKLNEQGMKRGGVAGKPDSVHKALEIIHHLLTRSH